MDDLCYTNPVFFVSFSAMCKKGGILINTRNQELKKARMTRYFIDAVKELAKSQPVFSITLRDIARQAGFNSATLYNYFKNMEQFMAFALMDLTSEMWMENTRREQTITDPMQQYFSLWEVQCRTAFENPNLFLYFFLMDDKQPVYDVGPSYFAIFKERWVQIGPRFRAQLSNASFQKKNQNYLMPCVEAGYLREEDLAELVRDADILFGGILLQVLRRPHEPVHVSEMTRRFFDTLSRTIAPLLLKDPPSGKLFQLQPEDA